MKRSTLVYAVAIACAATVHAADSSAQGTLTGDWGVLIVQPAVGCEWTGVIRLREQAGRITGDGVAEPPIGTGRGARCPRLEGQVQGDRRGETVRFGFATGQLGRADFEGRVAAEAKEMTGTWRTRAARGEWSAAK
jgi:hypothetical protein